MNLRLPEGCAMARCVREMVVLHVADLVPDNSGVPFLTDMSEIMSHWTGAGQAETLPKRVFVIDDHPTINQALTRILLGSDDFSPCGSASTAEDALPHLERVRPDLIILDLKLPRRNGLTLLPEIRSFLPNARVMVFTALDATPYAAMSFKEGAHGFLSKDASPSKLLSALRMVADGGCYAEPGDVIRAISRTLTDREMEIYQLIGRGLSAAEIALTLGLSSKTVDVHKTNIRGKLKLPDANSLLRAAVIEYERRAAMGSN